MQYAATAAKRGRRCGKSVVPCEAAQRQLQHELGSARQSSAPTKRSEDDCGFQTNEETAKTLRQRAARAANFVIAAGVENYDRERNLARLIHASPSELADRSPRTVRSILARLARALRSERNRGRAGHWTYDQSPHRIEAGIRSGKARLDRVSLRGDRAASG
jgi:hypothetical protein